MADNKLEIEVGVKVDDLTKGIAKSQKELDKLRDEQKQLDKEFKRGIKTEKQYTTQTKKNKEQIQRLTKSIDKETNSLMRLDNAQKHVGKGMNKMTKTAKNSATPAVVDLGRVISDMPYGIQGVANNLDQLNLSMKRVFQNSGGLKGGLRALGKELLSPTGLGVALAAVTSLWIAFGDDIKDFFASSKNVNRELEKLTKSLEEYEETLFGLHKTRVQGQKSAQDELTNLSLLKQQVENNNISNEDRLKALKRLQDLYPDYFGNISNEDALMGGLSTAYDNVTTAILKKAKAQAAADLITENAKKQIVLNDKLLKVSEKTNKAIAFGTNQEELYSEAVKAKVSNTEGYQKAVDSANKEVSDGLAEQQKIAKQIVGLQKESEQLAASINAEGGILGNLDGGNGGKSGGGNKSKDNPFKFNFDSDSWFELELAKLKTGITGFFGEEIKMEPTIDFEPKYKTDPVEKLTEDIMGVATEVQEFAAAISGFMSSSITNTITDLFTSIGEAMVNGTSVIGAIGQSLLGSFGKFLSTLGGMLVEYGVVTIAKGKLDIALATLFGPALIGAGGLAIAIGSALSIAGGAFSSAAQGGLSGGGNASSGDVGGRGSSGSRYSSSNYSSGGMGSGNVVFEIQGTKLVGVLNNTLKRNKSLGGTNNLLFT